MTNEQATLAVGWIGEKALDRDGRKLGRIADVYVDVGSGQPTWAVVRGGAWRRHARFVPLEGVTGAGHALKFPLTKPQLRTAVKVRVDGRLEADEAEALSRHYRLVALDQPAPGWDRIGGTAPGLAPATAPGVMPPGGFAPQAPVGAPSGYETVPPTAAPGAGSPPEDRQVRSQHAVGDGVGGYRSLPETEAAQWPAPATAAPGAPQETGAVDQLGEDVDLRAEPATAASGGGHTPRHAFGRRKEDPS